MYWFTEAEFKEPRQCTEAEFWLMLNPVNKSKKLHAWPKSYSHMRVSDRQGASLKYYFSPKFISKEDIFSLI